MSIEKSPVIDHSTLQHAGSIPVLSQPITLRKQLEFNLKAASEPTNETHFTIVKTGTLDTEKERKNDLERLNSILKQTDFSSLKFSSFREHRSWFEKLTKINEIYKYLEIMQQTINSKGEALKSDTIPENSTFIDIIATLPPEEKEKFSKQALDVLINKVFRAAGKLSIYRNFQDLLRMVKRNNLGQNTENQINYGIFNYSNTITAQIAGKSLIELLEDKELLSPAQYYRFIVESNLISKGKNPNRYIEDNIKRPPRNEFPALSAHHILRASTEIVATSFADEEIINTHKTPSGKLDTEIRSIVKNILKKIGDYKKTLQQVILTPSSPHFTEIKNIINAYLQEDDTTKQIALSVLFPTNGNEITTLFRTIEDFISQDIEVDFYTQLRNPLVEYLKTSQGIFGLFCKDNIPTILSEKKENLEPIEIKTLEDITLSIANNTSNRHFSITPDNDTVLYGLICPKKIDIFINNNVPKRFSVVFHFQDISEENQIIEIDINSKIYQEGLDWTFVEKPSNLCDMRDTLLSVIKDLLINIENQVKQEREQHRLKRFQSLAITTSPTAKKIENSRPESAQEVLKVKTRGEAIHNNTEATLEQTELKTNKKEILIPEKDIFEKHLRRLSSTDKINVQEAISNFNNSSNNRLYKLKSLGPNGEILYALRTKATAHGGIRILLKNVNSCDTNQQFEIVDIGYRKDIYRDMGIE